MEGSKGYEIMGVKEQPSENDIEAYNVAFSLSGERVLEKFIGNKKGLEKLKDFVDEELLLKMSDPEFQDKYPEDYIEMVKRVNYVQIGNEELMSEIGSKTIEQFKIELTSYLSSLDIELDVKEIEDRIDKVRIVLVDHFKYIALQIINGEHDDYAGAFYPQGNIVAINITQVRKSADQFAQGVYKDEFEMIFHDHLTKVIRHELMHAASYHNFWDLQIENGRDTAPIRRAGLATMPGRKDSNERLRPLSEGVTEKLTIDIIESFSTTKYDGMKRPVSYWEKGSYLKEMEVVDTLCELIDWKYLVAAYFNKEAFIALNKELKSKAGLTLSDINMFMNKDGDYLNKHTINLIKSKLPLMKKIRYLLKQ